MAVALVMRASLWSVFLSLPLVMVAIACLDLAPSAIRHPNTLREFLRRRVWAAALGGLAVLLFLAVDHGFGLEAALLLVVLPGYFVYKVLVARDMLFVAVAVLLVVSALASVSPPINLGPRNVLAYVAFFEVARQLIKRASAAADEYFSLRREHPDAREWGLSERWLSAWDWLFTLFSRDEGKEATHARTSGPAV